MEKVSKEMEEMNLTERRFRLITVARYRNREKVARASKKIDEIRKGVGSKGASMTKILRKWRDKRYGASSS